MHTSRPAGMNNSELFQNWRCYVYRLLIKAKLLLSKESFNLSNVPFSWSFDS